MKAPEAQTIPASVDLFLPADFTRILQELVNAEKAYATIEIIHDALWMMRGSEMTREERKAELSAEIQAGLDSGGPIEVTPEFWRELRRRGREHLAWISTLREQNNIGNTLLPEKLHAYVHRKIDSGTFLTPTAVVCAALGRLKPFGGSLPLWSDEEGQKEP
jgi:Arc/MetJ-type ribon-helix-helix transcriptional regulator